MISYVVKIVIEEEHEDDFDHIIGNVCSYASGIDGVLSVYGIESSYFEYNDDSDPFWDVEEDDE